jgi:membrane-bound serine protease (ClpP class)
MASSGFLYDIAFFFTQPWVSAFLILTLMAGMILELKTPGTIIPILTGLLAATAYFGSYYLMGLTEWWEVVIFIAGFLLMAVEIFVVPGFGIAGISGIVLLVSGLVLAALPNEGMDFEQVHTADAVTSLTMVLGGVLAGIVVLLYAVKNIINSRFFRKVALHQALDAKDGYAIGMALQKLVGKPALVRTVLRPSGKVEIEGKLYEATSFDSFIEVGKWVYVTDVEGNMLRVRADESAAAGTDIVKA